MQETSRGVGKKTTKAPNTSKLTSKDTDEYDPELFELLQDKCRILAKAEHRAVFTNRALKEIATHLPRTRTAFRRIHGIGTVKTEKYGDDFCRLSETIAMNMESHIPLDLEGASKTKCP